MASSASTRPAESSIRFSVDFIANVPAYLAHIRRHRHARWGRQYGLQGDQEQLVLLDFARIATRTGVAPASNDPHFGVVLTQRLSNSIRTLKREHPDFAEGSHVSLDEDVDGEDLGARFLVDETGPNVVLETAERNQAIAALYNAIEALTARQREIIQLVLADMTDAEIAVELGVSVQAVNKTKRNAITKLKQFVPAEYGGR